MRITLILIIFTLVFILNNLFIKSKNFNRPLFITGTMRSGSSMTGNIIYNSGIDLFGDFKPLSFSSFNKKEHNLDGYFCLEKINHLDSTLFRTLGIDWKGNFSNIQTVPEWYLNEIKNITNKMEKHEPWGLKSVSFCKTIKFWIKMVNNPILIVTFRHPDSVLQSIINKNKNSDIGDKYWINSYKNILSLTIPIIYVYYDDFIENPYKVYSMICRKLKFYNIQIKMLTQKKLNRIVKKNRKHFNPQKKMTMDEQYIWNTLIKKYKSQFI